MAMLRVLQRTNAENKKEKKRYSNHNVGTLHLNDDPTSSVCYSLSSSLHKYSYRYKYNARNSMLMLIHQIDKRNYMKDTALRSRVYGAFVWSSY